MNKQINKSKRMVFTLVACGLCLGVLPVAQSSTSTLLNEVGFKTIKTNGLARDVKPVAGRNRRRSKLPVIRPAFPRANSDRVRASRSIDKLRINVLSNDDGNKLQVININPRSAGGARVSISNGMAIYQVPRHFVGKDSFWYTMADATGRQHSARVTVCVCDK